MKLFALLLLLSLTLVSCGTDDSSSSDGNFTLQGEG